MAIHGRVNLAARLFPQGGAYSKDASQVPHAYLAGFQVRRFVSGITNGSAPPQITINGVLDALHALGVDQRKLRAYH